jgi:hypothetical protein
MPPPWTLPGLGSLTGQGLSGKEQAARVAR